ncbi:MAG: hypothetical protein JWL77_936 [Chthonomonadaceae bacterium]|nr:hypothetical protein [Chthonomonadaceae bacterium]
MNRAGSLLIALGLLMMAGMAQAAPPTPGGKRVLEPFDYHGVTLDDGDLKRQFDETRAYYLRIPNDDLLKGFRARAGFPAPGVDLGGWYSSDTFHIFGQILSGLARMYAATGDPACKEKVDLLIREWGKCVAPDGFFYFSKAPNAPHYIYDKMVGGLVDSILYCHNTEAPDYLSRITDWAVTNLNRTRPYGGDSNEWYTLSENLYRAYLATNDPKYRDFAQVWEYTEYWNRYAQKRDIFGGGSPTAYHAYSHVNTLGGAGAAYLVTGEAHYLDTLRNAYDFLQTKECFATGGFGPNEQITPPAARRQMLATSHATFETQCGSWAAFKMTKYLLSLTGDARYGDWTERLVLNGIGASIPMSGDGRVLYYSDYNPSEGTKRNCDQGWTCCAGTRPMAIADYHDLIYLHAPDGLYVNLYTPSTVRWTPTGGSGAMGSSAVTVRQTTRFPASDTVEFTVQTARPSLFGLHLRAPGWLSGRATAELNGKPISVFADARHWFSLSRIWKEGDHLTLHLPMKLHAERLDADQPSLTAILYGPVTLAARTPVGNPAGKIDVAHLEQIFVAGDSEPLTYHLRADPNVLLRPFSSYREGEPYYLYLDPASEHRVSYRAATFSPNWKDSGQFRFGNTVGATVEYHFEGVGIKWLGYRFDDAGQAEVRIDGQVVGIVDQYGPGRDLPFQWEHRGLARGKHTILLTLLPDKNPASRDRFLNVAGFETLP